MIEFPPSLIYKTRWVRYVIVIYMARTTGYHRLSKKKREDLHKQFVKAVVDLETTKGGERFLYEILTPSEIEMLSKRFAALILISQNKFSKYRIAKILKMTTSTITRLSKSVEAGRFKYFKEIEYDGENAFVEYFKILFDFNVFPDRKRGRWAFLYETHDTSPNARYKRK